MAGPIPSGTAIAQDALTYQGSPYIFGGAPGTVKGKDAGADCSAFVNMVLGRDLGMAIPGYKAGAYTGAVHGPVVLSYAGWSGATTLPAGTAPSGGDLCVWPGAGAFGHIGIAVDSTRMVSALDSQNGVKVTPIVGSGPVGAKLMYRRVNGSAQGTGGSTGSGASSAAGSVAAGLLTVGTTGLVIAAGVLVVIAAAAWLVTAGVVAGAGVLAAKAAGG